MWPFKKKKVSVKGNWKWPWQKGKHIKVTIRDGVGSKDVLKG